MHTCCHWTVLTELMSVNSIAIVISILWEVLALLFTMCVHSYNIHTSEKLSKEVLIEVAS